MWLEVHTDERQFDFKLELYYRQYNRALLGGVEDGFSFTELIFSALCRFKQSIWLSFVLQIHCIQRR